MYHYSIKLRILIFKMSNHFTLSMSVKVLVVSFKTLTVLSSVDDNWFIHPHWGELELDAGVETPPHQDQRLLVISFGNP